MALAQRLNELAAANSQGLLSDDEYRLLRQSVFEQHAGNAVPPVEVPLVSIERRKQQPPAAPQRRSSEPETQPAPAPTSFLRRLTSRKPTTTPPTAKRLAFLPRILQKRTEAPPPPAPIAIAYPAPAASPSSSSFSVPPPSLHTVFDDDNLPSARAIRAAITAAEDEAARLTDTFAALEAATLRRLRSQRARRLPAATPASVAVLLEGREWREHRLVPSPSAPALNRARAPSDASTRTASSSAQAPPPSPLSARFRLPTLRRKASLSSLSSHTPSLAPSGSSTLPSLAPSSAGTNSNSLPAPPSSGGTSSNSLAAPLLARSTSALGLRRLMRGVRAPSTDSLNTPTRTPTPTSSYAPPHTLSPPHTPKRTRTPTRAPSTPTRTPSSRTPNTPTSTRTPTSSSTRTPPSSRTPTSTRTNGTPPTHKHPHPHHRGASTGSRNASTASRAEDDIDDAELADIRARRDALVARYTARVEFLRAKLKGAELHEKLLRK